MSRRDRLLSAAFLAPLAATALIDTCAPVAPLRVFAFREHEEEPPHRHLADGSLARGVERDLAERSRVERSVRSWYALGLYATLDEAGPLVVAGEDGWLFLRQRIGGDGPPTDIAVERTTLLWSLVDVRLRAAGVRFLLLPIARKAVLASEQLPPGVDPRADLEREASAAFSRAGIEFVDTLAVARELEGDFYQRRDSHWSPAARLQTARRTAEQFAGDRAADPRTRIEGPRDVPEGVDMLRYLGIDPERVRAAIEVRSIPRWRVAGQVDEPPASTSGERPRVWLSGSSFSAGGGFGQFLAHFADADVDVLSRHGGDAFLLLNRAWRARPAERPDIVVAEVPLYTALEGGTLERALLELGAFPLGERVLDLELPGVFSRAPRWNEGHVLDEQPLVLAAIPAGRLHRRLDGALAVRLERASGGALIEVGTRGSQRTVWTRWDEGATRIDVPLGEAGGGAVTVLARGTGGAPLRLLALDLVLGVDPGAVREGIPGPLRGGADGTWQQDVSFDPPLRCEPGGRTILEVRTGSDERRDCELAALGVDGAESSPLPVLGIERFGQVVVPDGEFGLERIARLRLSGRGAAPVSFVARARHARP